MTGNDVLIMALVIMVVPFAISIPLTIGMVNKKKEKSDENTGKI